MVSGKTVRVVMKIQRKRIEDFIDWYGKNFRIINYEPDDITISFSANDTALRFWAIQYSKYVTVLEPKSLVKMLREDTEGLVKKYLSGK